MFKAIIIIATVGVVSYAFTDLADESVFLSVVLPMAVFVSLVSFAIWLVIFARQAGLDEDEGIQRVENNAPVSPDDIDAPGP